MAEMPSFQNLYNAYGDKVIFLFVANDKEDKVVKFLEDKGYELPVFLQASQVPEEMNSNSLPTTYILDRDGDIVVSKTGAADWNRTSPFAFTGNKFEFRAVGSMANCANSMTVLNTIVAKQLKEFKAEVDKLIDNKSFKKDEAIFNILREYIKQSKNILFEGNSYSKEWEKEAAKRGLSNNKTTPQATYYF